MSDAPYVLVVDDNELNAKLVSYALEVYSVASRVAKEAGEALRLIAAETPAVILMDLQLPGIDGLTLTRRLRADPRYRELPIIAVTAYAMASDEQAAEQAGCSGFMSKPIDVRALSRLVLSLLGRDTAGEG